MRILVTGSSGHLGEGLMRVLPTLGHEAVGLDVNESPFTRLVGSIVDRRCIREAMKGIDAVVHAASLHKPHVATHTRQAFIDTNITGTLNLLEEAVAAGVKAFVFTSTTSAFGGALTPPNGAPAAWITEDVHPVPRNIYGVTKVAAEDLCELIHRRQVLPCVILRTSRFFAEEDDDEQKRNDYADLNAKVNELLCRRADLEDIVAAHVLAVEKAHRIGFRRYIVTATTPFRPEDASGLHRDAPAVVRRRVSGYDEEYARRGWKMFPQIDRVYINDRARSELDWRPRYDFASMLDALRRGEDPRSPLARAVGSKPYHDTAFVGQPYPVEGGRV